MIDLPGRLQVGFSTRQNTSPLPCSRDQWEKPVDMSHFSDPGSPVLLRSSAFIPHAETQKKVRADIKVQFQHMLDYAYRRPKFIKERLLRSIACITPQNNDNIGEASIADFIVTFSDGVAIGLVAVPFDKSQQKKHSLISIENKLVVVKIHIQMEKDHIKCLISMLEQLARLSEDIFGSRLPRRKKLRQNGELPSKYRHMKNHSSFH